MLIGILGYGSIGSRHGRNLTSLGHKVIVHDPSMANSLPKEVVIEKSDAVVIASPTSEHASDLLLCMQEKKPCFVEKPIANVLIKNIDKHLRWPLMVGYNLRFHPCAIKAKEWLDEGRIGAPYWGNFVCAQFNDKPEYLRDGVTLNWSHEIDLALHLLGESDVAGAAITKNDDISDILLRHSESGAQSTVHLDYLARIEQRGFSIAGSDGLIVGNIPARSIILLDNDGIPRQAEQYPGSFDDDYMTEMAAFLAKVEGTGGPILGCTAKEAIEVLKVCLKAKKVAKI